VDNSNLSSALAVLAGMLGRRYLHVSLSSSENLKIVANNHVQQVIEKADDWLRYADNCWIVWTSDTAEQFYQKLAAIDLLKGASILILEVNLSRSNRSGQLPDWVWDWLSKERSGGLPSYVLPIR
jgi:hypothetical protein